MDDAFCCTLVNNRFGLVQNGHGFRCRTGFKRSVNLLDHILDARANGTVTQLFDFVLFSSF